jgi:hypothetical protein
VKHVHVLMYNGKFYMEIIANTVNTFYLPTSRVSKRQFVRRNKTALEPGDRLRLHSKLRIWSSIKRIYDQQPEFKRLSEFYIIIFLSKLKILENTKKNNQNKTSMAKAIWPFRDLHAPSYVSGPRTDVPNEPSSHRPCQLVYIGIVFVLLHHYPKRGDLGP